MSVTMSGEMKLMEGVCWPLQSRMHRVSQIRLKIVVLTAMAPISFIWLSRTTFFAIHANTIANYDAWRRTPLRCYGILSNAHTRTQTYTLTHSHTNLHTHSLTHSLKHKLTHSLTHTHARVFNHTRMYTLTHYSYTHKHTCVCVYTVASLSHFSHLHPPSLCIAAYFESAHPRAYLACHRKTFSYHHSSSFSFCR